MSRPTIEPDISRLQGGIFNVLTDFVDYPNELLFIVIVEPESSL
jgi:hypothetical protein